MTDRKPEGPADPRPDNEPYYIDGECSECGTELVLKDLETAGSTEDIWHDEWVCPRCPESPVYMDVPENWVEKKVHEAKKSERKRLEEVMEEVEP